MNYILRLSGLLPGESCVVKTVNAQPEIRRRLQDMGLIPGTKVECLFKSPGGDPSAYRIRGAVVAIRCCDADDIFVFKKHGGV